MQINFHKTAKVTLVLVYLVIIAGAIVRMTGSGMGCPDWPKCFGHYIPPTDISELEWHKEKEINKGQIIIIDETLQVAKENFKTGSTLNKDNWERYTKHEYAEFNATHTWIEYVNRLFGALAGIGTLLLAFLSLRFWKSNKILSIISWLTVIGMSFQGWLGATVVYSVLEPVKITIHMIMALVIVLMLLFLVFNTTDKKPKYSYKNKLSTYFLIALILTLVQIVLGTQVRQFVDEQITLVGYNSKELWLENATVQFYLHRSFSILVVALNVFIFLRIRKEALGFHKIRWVILLISLEIFSGILMYYINFPFSTQAFHLVLATLLFGVQYYLLLEALNAKKSHKTS